LWNADEWQKNLNDPKFTDEMLKYICEMFIRIIEYYSTYYKVLTLRDKLSDELKKKDDNLIKEGLKVWILQNKFLVHDYYFEKDRDRNVAIDTFWDGNEWKSILFDRNNNNLEELKKLFPEISKDKETITIDGRDRYLLNSYTIDVDLSEIAKDLVEIRQEVEKVIGEK
jgi:hypothetical protein